MNGPQAHPFRYFDRIIERGRNYCAVVKLVGGNETLLDRQGAPPRPYPAALVVEILAQAALPLAAPGEGEAASIRSGPSGSSPEPPGFLVGMDEVLLHGAVWPGDRLLVRAEIVGRLGDMIRVRCEAEVEGTLVAEGELTIAKGTGSERGPAQHSDRLL